MEKKRASIAIVTGASSGMGREFVRQIAESYRSISEIWVIARREQALLTLQEELKDKTTIRTLPMDLAEKDACAELAALLKKEKPVIRILVNSAGLGHAGKLETQDVDQILNMIDVNCRALTAVTMTCLPYFRKGSRILQMDSGSAFLPQPGFAAYAASKAYVLSLSRALKEELRSRQISVTAVCPGPVKTDFFATGGIKLNPVKRLFLIKPERVVRKALFDAEKGKAVSISGGSMKLVRAASGVLPQGLMTAAVSDAVFFLKRENNILKMDRGVLLWKKVQSEP